METEAGLWVPDPPVEEREPMTLPPVGVMRAIVAAQDASRGAPGHLSGRRSEAQKAKKAARRQQRQARRRGRA